jgi:hypothetical protein
VEGALEAIVAREQEARGPGFSGGEPSGVHVAAAEGAVFTV